MHAKTMKEPFQNKNKAIKTELLRNSRNSVRSELNAENVTQKKAQGSLEWWKDK